MWWEKDRGVYAYVCMCVRDVARSAMYKSHANKPVPALSLGSSLLSAPSSGLAAAIWPYIRTTSYNLTMAKDNNFGMHG